MSEEEGEMYGKQPERAIGADDEEALFLLIERHRLWRSSEPRFRELGRYDDAQDAVAEAVVPRVSLGGEGRSDRRFRSLGSLASFATKPGGYGSAP